jgi:hypothetical protein
MRPSPQSVTTSGVAQTLSVMTLSGQSVFGGPVQLKILAQSFFARGRILEAAHPNLPRRRPVGTPIGTPDVHALLGIVNNPRGGIRGCGNADPNGGRCDFSRPFFWFDSGGAILPPRSQFDCAIVSSGGQGGPHFSRPPERLVLDSREHDGTLAESERKTTMRGSAARPSARRSSPLPGSPNCGLYRSQGTPTGTKKRPVRRGQGPSQGVVDHIAGCQKESPAFAGQFSGASTSRTLPRCSPAGSHLSTNTTW